jgi:hypothetical protein
MKINAQRLSRYITSRDCKSATDYLIDMYSRMSIEQRLEIKQLLKNATISQSNNKKSTRST